MEAGGQLHAPASLLPPAFIEGQFLDQLSNYHCSKKVLCHGISYMIG